MVELSPVFLHGIGTLALPVQERPGLSRRKWPVCEPLLPTGCQLAKLFQPGEKSRPTLDNAALKDLWQKNLVKCFATITSQASETITALPPRCGE